MQNAEPLRGVCHFHSETGTEGGYWAFQESNHISPDGKHWSYDGLHVLKDGDLLTIFSAEDPTLVVWTGVILLQPYRLFTEHVFNFWIHADQEGVARETWARYFLDQHPATLVLASVPP